MIIMAIIIIAIAVIVILAVNSNNARSGKEQKRRWRLHEAFDDKGTPEDLEEEDDAKLEIDEEVREKETM